MSIVYHSCLSSLLCLIRYHRRQKTFLIPTSFQSQYIILVAKDKKVSAA
jgi:hypothetical protein